MKQKVGTVFEADIFRRAKRQEVDDGRPLSDLLQDALALDQHRTAEMPPLGRRDAAYRLFCELPIRISPEQFRAVLQADAWDP